VTYCPLCATGIVFERKVLGKEIEFGVSGLLWQSNLLMYDRTGSTDTESLWSQALGEAVLGKNTGERLKILPSDVLDFGEWKKLNPNGKVLSTDTGKNRDYSLDPYEDYYTIETVSFGASFDDDRLHPKALVAGIEIDEKYKAYDLDVLSVGETTDNFLGKNIVVKKDASGAIFFSASGERISHTIGFWFSWLAVHPDTELLK